MKNAISIIIAGLLCVGLVVATNPILTIRNNNSQLQYFSATSKDSLKFVLRDSLFIFNNGQLTKLNINQIDSAYFTSGSLPSVTTVAAVMNTTTNKATCTVKVTNTGGAPLTERGICWSTSSTPTITDNKSSGGTSIGQFYVMTSALTVGTTYYVRAFATNCLGTSYGSAVKMLALPSYVYTPSGFNFLDESTDYNWNRHAESDHFILFWQPGFGSNPNTATGLQNTVNVSQMLKTAEACFNMYSDTLKFIDRNNSTTQKRKILIFLHYTDTWVCNGSGYDDAVGALNICPWGVNAVSGADLCHEIGHVFQYLVHVDLGDNTRGFMYGLGSGSNNGYWEQTAQWQAFQLMPSQAYTMAGSDFAASAYKSTFHEDNRYSNSFINYYWDYKHGRNMVGRIWRESLKPEDPAQAYMRLDSLTLDQYNDETWDMASRWATWDIPALRTLFASHIGAISTKLIATSTGYLRVDSVNCPQDQGINIISLTPSITACTVKAVFQGLAGTKGYRNVDPVSRAGWRYGFVALLKDKTTRLYGTMQRDANGTATLDIPAGISRLWLVVTGAPTTYKQHTWDSDVSNDEQWPYQIKLTNALY